jgi:hypothetical protein
MRTPIIVVAGLTFFAVAAFADDAARVPGPPTPSGPPSPALPLTPVNPNLVPIASRMAKGVISVRNTGPVAAGPFKVTVECNAMGKKGGCAEPPKGAAVAYIDGAFPNKFRVLAPNLAPGAVFSHKLSFWDALVWSSGNYEFTVVADASGLVAEVNEGDNTGGTVMNVP